MVHPLPHFEHRTRGIRPQNVRDWQFNPWPASANPDIQMVQRCAADIDEDFIGSRNRRRHFFILDALYIATFKNYRSFHDWSPRHRYR